MGINALPLPYSAIAVCYSELIHVFYRSKPVSYSIELSSPFPQVSLLTFTDAQRRNQLCWAAVDELGQRLREVRESGGRVVVLASGLEGHWFEHAWLRDLSAGIEGGQQTGSGGGWFAVQEELTHEDVVSIAAIAGDTSGGGAEFGWACDLRIAEQQAQFAQPEISMGLTTGIGGCSRLARIAGRTLAAEMVFTGKPVTAARLHTLGAVTQLVDTGAALPAALEIASHLVAQSPAALAGLKRIMKAGLDMSLADSLRYEQEVFQSVVTTDAAREGMRAVQATYDAQEPLPDGG